MWTRTYGDSFSFGGFSTQQTLDGGFIITGSTSSFGTNQTDVYLIKTDAGGNILWSKTIGQSMGMFFISGILQTADGYVIMGSYSYPSIYYVRLIKTDANGNGVWSKTFLNGGPVHGKTIQKAKDDGYIILAATYGIYGHVADWLLRTDANGDTLWTGTIGDSLDIGYSVQQASDGGYIITGSTESLSTGDDDVWLIKIAPDLTTILDEYPQSILNDYQLKQNYPNPFNPTTTFEFSLPQSGFVTLKVYNILGEEVATLVSERLSVGEYKYDWDAGRLASGVYLYRIQAGEYVEVRKMVLMR